MRDHCLNNLAMPEADIGVRVSMPLTDRLDIRRVCDCRFALYASPRLAAMATRAVERGGPPGSRYLAFNDESADLPENRWIRRMLRGTPPILPVNATTVLLAAARAGLGVAALPRYVGDCKLGLHRVPAPVPGPTEGLFLVTRREQRGVARVRAVVDYLSRIIAAERALFAEEDGI